MEEILLTPEEVADALRLTPEDVVALEGGKGDRLVFWLIHGEDH